MVLVLTAVKVGLEVVAMFWMVLMTPAPLSEKLGELKVAMPRGLPSALAFLRVTVPPEPEELEMVPAPDCESTEVTAAAPAQLARVWRQKVSVVAELTGMVMV